MNNDVYAVLAKIGPALDASVPESAEWKWEDRFDAALVVLSRSQADALYAALTEACDSAWTSDNTSECPEEVGVLLNDMGGLRRGQHLFTSWIDAFSFAYLSSWPWNDGESVSIRFGIYYPGGDFTDGAAAKITIMRGLGMEE